MSADVQQLLEMTLSLNLLWSAPFQILLTIVFLWQELGPSVLAGVAMLLLVVPINAYVAAKVKQLKVKKLNTVSCCIKVALTSCCHKHCYIRSKAHLVEDPISQIDQPVVSRKPTSHFRRQWSF